MRRSTSGTTAYQSLLGHASRGSGLYSDLITIRISSLLSVAIAPYIHPTLISLSGLVVGTGSGVLAILAVDVRPTWALGLIVAAGWQLAYVLDCADGQIARYTGKLGPAGAAVDVLCDFAVQSTLTAAICATVAKQRDVHVVVLALFAATWMVNIVVMVLYRRDDGEGHSLMPSKSPLVAALKLSRDYGFLVFVFGLSYAFWRPAMPWLLVGVLIVNTGFLVVSIGNQVHLSIRASGRPTGQDQMVGLDPGEQPTVGRPDLSEPRR